MARWSGSSTGTPPVVLAHTRPGLCRVDLGAVTASDHVASQGFTAFDDRPRRLHLLPTASPMATLTSRCASREPFGQIGQRRIRPPSSNVEAGVSRRRLRGLTPAQGCVRASFGSPTTSVDDVVPEGQDLSHQVSDRLKVGITNLLEGFQERLASPPGGVGVPHTSTENYQLGNGVLGDGRLENAVPDS